MKIQLIQVGKTVNKIFIEGIDDYVGRLKHYADFSIVTIPDIKNTKSISAEQQKTLEGAQILKQLQPQDYVVLLDEHGKEYTSVEFARWIERQQHSARKVTFVIGGPYGFSQDVYDRANSMISLSKMTFSHQMIRLIFCEQLYRAHTIIRGEPYHHV